MATTAARKWEDKYRAALRRGAQRTALAARSQEHTIGAAATGWVLGFGERKGWDFPTLGNVDHKLVYAGAALAAAYSIRNARIKRIASSIADGLVSVYLYDAGKSGDFGLDEGGGAAVEDAEI